MYKRQILNTLLPIEKWATLIIINAVIVITNLLLNFFDKQDFSTEKKSVEIITKSEDFLPLSETEKLEFVRVKTNFNTFTYQIKSIDLREDKVILKVFY